MTALKRTTLKDKPKTDTYDSELVLQIIALSGDTVIASEQLDERAERTTFTVGFDVDADYPVRSALLPEASAYTLAELKVMAYMTAGRAEIGWLQLINVPYGATGEVLCDGELFDIVELRDAGQLRRDEARRCDTLKLPAGARCRVSLGDDIFVFCSLPRPKTLKRLSLYERFDRGFLYTIASAAAIMMTGVTTLSLIPEAPSALEIRHVPAVERFVSVELCPQERLSDSRDTSDTSDHSRDPSDTSDTSKARDQSRDQSHDEPSRASGGDAKTQARAVARELTVGSGLETISQGMLEGSLDELQGQSQSVNNRHQEGIAVDLGTRRTAKLYRHTIRTLRTGYGTCSAGEVDDRGAPCTGMKRGRAAVSLIPPHKTKRPPIIVGKPLVGGRGLTRGEVRRVIMTRMGAYKHCYERALQGAHNLKGRIEVKLVISAQGRVVLAKLTRDEVDQPSVGRCVIKQMKLLRFPNAKDGSRTTVKYPLVFRAS